MDVRITLGASTTYWQFDVGLARLVAAGTDVSMWMGSLANVFGSGTAMTSARTRALAVYVDDGGAAITSDVFARAGVFRHLLTYTGGNREQEAAGVVGQIVSVAGTNRHNMCGVMGSYEAQTSLTVDGQAWSTDPWIQAAVIGRVSVGTAITTVNANGILAGFAAMSNTVSFSAQNGTYTGLYVGSWSGAVDWEFGIYIQAGAVTQGIKVGELSSTTAGSGVTLDDTTTRVVEVHADDNNAARAVGTQGRAIFGRTMIYADNACEDWGVHGLSKISGVAKTGNVSAGVVGAFESTGTCSIAIGSGNSYFAGVMGRVGGGGTFTITSSNVVGVLSFYNTSVTNAFSGTGTCAFMAVASEIEGTGDWDYGLYVKDTIQAIYANCGVLASDARIAQFYGTVATPNHSDGYGAFEIDITVSGTGTGQVNATSTWINLGASATVPNYMAIHTDGIYDGGATLTNASISMTKFSCLLASNPAWLSIWELNFAQDAYNVVDAIFNVNDAARGLGYVEATPSAAAIGSIPFFSVGGGAVKYIRIYADATT